MRTITRRELYERVWVAPRVHTARELGVHTDKLARLCRRNRIPIPPQGFWNRGAEDRQKLIEPLPDSEQDWEIKVEPSEGHVPDDSPPGKPGIFIPRTIGRGHRLIQETRQLLDSGYVEEDGRVRPTEGCLNIFVTRKCRPKAYRVMHAIIRECEARGWTITIGSGCRPRTVVNVNGGEVGIGIDEILEREGRKFTEEERRKNCYGMQLYPRHPSGRVVLKLDWPNGKGRRAWREGKRFSLEYILKQFVEGVELAGIRKREYDEMRERAAERRCEEERERREREQAGRREAALVEQLFGNAESLAKSRTLRDYIQARIDDWNSRGVDTGEGSEAAQWIAWAKKQADRLDPLVKTDSFPQPRRQESFWEIMSSIGQA